MVTHTYDTTRGFPDGSLQQLAAYAYMHMARTVYDLLVLRLCSSHVASIWTGLASKYEGITSHIRAHCRLRSADDLS